MQYTALIKFSYNDSLHSVTHQEALKFNTCVECNCAYTLAIKTKTLNSFYKTNKKP